MKLLISLTLCTLLFTACPQVNTPSYNLGETIMLKLDEPYSISSENITMILTEVNDNRCPKDVNCIQAGKAVAKIDFAVGDAVSAIEVNSKGLCFEENGKCGSSTVAQGYNIQLFYVYPYPTENPKSGKNYTAKVMITKGGNGNN